MSRGTLDPAASYCFRVRGFHPLWPDFPDSSTNKSVHVCSPYPQHARTLVWALPISLAATLGIDVSFSSSGYLDVSVHRVPGVWLCIHHTSLEGCSSRFPHSDISGSKDICSSPKLFAAYHVFHRLLVPRHPPCALHSLTKTTSTCGCGFPSRPIALGPLVLGSYFNAFASTSLFLSIQSLAWPRMSCLSYLS